MSEIFIFLKTLHCTGDWIIWVIPNAFATIKEAFSAKGKLKEASYYTRQWLCDKWVVPSLQPSVPSDTGFPPINAHIPWRRLNLHQNELMVSEHDGCRRSLIDPGETFKRPKVAFGRPQDVTVGDNTEIPLGWSSRTSVAELIVASKQKSDWARSKYSSREI